MRGYCLIKIHLRPDFCIALAVVFMLLPLPWVFGWAIAVAIHELGHYACLRILKINVYGVIVGLTGVNMLTDPMPDRQELLCALAGPVASFLLIFLYKWLMPMAVCAGFHCLFNLIPIPPMDGGRALGCFRRLRKEKKLLAKEAK